MVMGITADCSFELFSNIEVDVSIDEVLKAIPGKRPLEKIVAPLEQSLMAARKIWCPQAVCCWLDIKQITAETITLALPGEERSVKLNTGFSTRFLAKAEAVLAAVYTLGSELEEYGASLSANGDFLGAYLTDIIGLVVLDKAGEKIRTLAENRANALGWGVSPFLSPGSVHGWDLDDQSSLCSFLPLETLGVKISKDAILTPFKSISCLIAVGPGYASSRVGTTCEVCSKKDTCTMKNH